MTARRNSKHSVWPPVGYTVACVGAFWQAVKINGTWSGALASTYKKALSAARKHSKGKA